MLPHPLRDLSYFLTAQARNFYNTLPKAGRPFTVSERYRVIEVTEPEILDLTFQQAVNMIPLPKRIIGTPRHRKEIAFAIGGKREAVMFVSTWDRTPTQTLGDILRQADDPNAIDGLVILSRMFCARHAKRSPSSILGCHALHGILFTGS